MKVEKFPSPGGVRIKEVLYEGVPLEIERLSYSGETLVKLPGLEFNYTAEGELDLAVVNLVDLALSFGSEETKGLEPGFWRMVDYLTTRDIEVLAEVSLPQQRAVLVRRVSRWREVLVTYGLDRYWGETTPIGVGAPVSLEGVIGFYADLWLEKNRLAVGVSDLSTNLYVAKPLKVKMERLNGQMDLTTIKAFLKGQ